MGMIMLGIMLLIPSVLSAPPVNILTSETGLKIESPFIQYAKIGQDVRIHLHLINDTKIITNTSATCFLHFYNQTGWDIESIPQLMEFEAYNGIDFARTIGAGNFTTEGIYPFVLTCNTSIQAGFFEGQLEVTFNGKATPSEMVIATYSILYLILFAGLIYIVIYSFGHFLKLDFDLIDLAYSYGAYFAFLALYYLSQYYVGNAFMESIMLLIMWPLGILLLLVPLIMFVISLTMGALKPQQMDYGTRRFRRTRL